LPCHSGPNIFEIGNVTADFKRQHVSFYPTVHYCVDYI
jgi:hypothetical protein